MASYSFNVSDFDFQTALNFTQVQTLEFTEAGSKDDELGEMRRPKNSGTLSFTGIYGPASITWSTAYLSQQTLTYEDGVEIETALTNYGPSAFTDNATYIHDLRGTYQKDDFTFYGGVSNVTDVQPYSTERAYPVSPVGRYGYLGLTYRMM